MPELPEVQTIVDDLNKKLIGRRITGVWFDAPKLIKKPKSAEFKRKIKGLKIEAIKRRGKNVGVYLSKHHLLLIHQKLTGHLLYGKWSIRKAQPSPAARGMRTRPYEYEVKNLIKGPLQEKVNDYIHLLFYLDNGWQLALSDLRKFAKVLFGSKEEIENSPDLKKLGQEPLDKNFTFEKFKETLRRGLRASFSRTPQGKRKIKQILMDQEIIAGIGNIYSDEILWQAKIHPFKQAHKLKTPELKNLYKATRQILKKAVKLRGTSISDFRDASGKPGAYSGVRKVYRKEGEPCPRCGRKIKRVKIGGRSAHYCPACQKF